MTGPVHPAAPFRSGAQRAHSPAETNPESGMGTELGRYFAQGAQPFESMISTIVSPQVLWPRIV